MLLLVNAAQPATRARTFVRAGLATAAAAALLTILYLVPPDHGAFYPRCWFHVLTGWQCPGCGGLRAVHRLLHGDWAGAFRFNPFFVTALPLAAAWLAWRLYLCRSGRAARLLPGDLRWLWFFLVASALFGVARNVIG